MVQNVDRGIALLFHNLGTRRGGVVSSTPRPHLTPRKDPVPIVHEAGWTPGPVWTGGKSRPHRDSIPDLQHLVAIPTELPGPQRAKTYVETIPRQVVSRNFAKQNSCTGNITSKKGKLLQDEY